MREGQRPRRRVRTGMGGEKLFPKDGARHAPEVRPGRAIADDDDRFDARQPCRRVGELLQPVDPLAAVEVAVGRDEHLGLDLPEAVDDSRGPEVGRARRERRADARRAEHRGDGLRAVRHQRGHPVARPDAERREGGGEGVALRAELAARDGLAPPGLVGGDERGRVVLGTQQIGREAQGRAVEPAGARHPAAAVEHAHRRRLEAHVRELRDGRPERLRLFDAPAIQRRVAVAVQPGAVAVDEAAHRRSGDTRIGRAPDRLGMVVAHDAPSVQRPPPAKGAGRARCYNARPPRGTAAQVLSTEEAMPTDPANRREGDRDDAGDVPRESMAFDVVIVGAGPAGLAAACRLGQLAAERGTDLTVCVVEKGAEVGAHIVSGALLDPRPLTELFPDWAARGAPVELAVTDDRVEWLIDERRSVRIPKLLVPVTLHNAGHYVISLGELCRWLAAQAEALGVSVLPGFAAVEPLFDANGRVCGVATGDKGRSRDGTPKPTFQRGYALEAKYVIFAEGCRGHLGQILESRFGLRRGRDPQHYGLGFKEIWEIDPAKHAPGSVLHTTGWPLADDTDGGGFLYHASGGRVSVGFVVSLGYRNPHLAPFSEFQRFKHHPAVADVLRGGRRIGYGARAVTKGGLRSLPEIVFPGGLLVGCNAGFLNNAKIKGTHTAMKS